MTATYLGMRRRTAAALAVAAVAAGVALGLAVEPPHPCGTVTEDHVTAPAYCGDPAELVDRLDAIRDGRTGGRFAPVLAPSDYAGRPAPAAYGPDRDPETADYAAGWQYPDGAERAALDYGRALGGIAVTPREVAR